MYPCEEVCKSHFGTSYLLMAYSFVYRFLMCHLIYTNFQREGSVCNMTAEEVASAEKSGAYYVIKVWNHKTSATHGSARIAAHQRIYELLVSYMDTKRGSALVFTTATGERVTHSALELEKLGEHFGKNLAISPTLNRKQIASAVAKCGSEADVRATAKHMTHSLEVHRSSYQQPGDADDAVDRYLNLHETAHFE